MPERVDKTESDDLVDEAVLNRAIASGAVDDRALDGSYPDGSIQSADLGFTPGEPNTPPWSPIADSPITLSGSDSYTVDVGTHGGVMVEFIGRSGNATEQLAFQVAGKTSEYFYYDVTGSRVAPDSLIPLTSHTDIVGTRFTMWPIADGYSAGGAVACPTGKNDTVAPAMRWNAYDTGGMPSTISFQNTETADNLDFTIAVYSRP